MGHRNNPFITFAGPPLPVGGWKELGRTTLGSAGDTISVGSLADKRYLMVLTSELPSGVAGAHTRLNGISTGSYAARRSVDGAADTTVNAQTLISDGVNNSTPKFHVEYLANRATSEKLTIEHMVNQNTAGAGTAPRRSELVGKFGQTAGTISTFAKINDGAGDLDVDSQVVVLEWDPADIHTDNFWQELASADLSGGAANTLSSGIFTKRKYLWVQAYMTNSGASTPFAQLQLDGNTGNNYAWRRSSNGAADTTANTTNIINYESNSLSSTLQSYANFFIINISAQEKLVISHSVNTGGSGAASAPNRTESVGKFAMTTDQIDSVQIIHAGLDEIF